MIVGCVKEIKTHEYRVGLLPFAVRQYVEQGHRVLIETGAGQGSSASDQDYIDSGATILKDAASVYEAADMIVKVKEPLPAEFPYLREGQIVFTYFHFASDETLLRTCLERKVTAIAYETVRDENGALPLLKPMSEVAGSMAPLLGSYYLMNPNGGRGVLPSGIPGVLPANVVVIGGGVVGRCSARIAAGLGCKVTILDTSIATLTNLRATMPANVFAEFSNSETINDILPEADIVIGSVLIPGGKAPKLVQRKHLKTMKPGSVMVDVAIDQGGCFETSHPTTHDDPTYVVDGVIHYCVANMPGAFARTSTIALNNSTLPYGLQIAKEGVLAAIQENKSIKSGLNTINGQITCRAVAQAFALEDLYLDPDTL